MKEDQNTPPQNMSLGIKIIFELKANGKQQTGGILCPPAFCLKADHKFPFVKVSLRPTPVRGEEMTPITRDPI